jgi:hypothetical protein
MLFRSYGRPNTDSFPTSTELPKFITSLRSLALIEGQTAVFDCKFSPSGDPSLKIVWLLNGKSILASSRISTLADFGYAVLEINPVTVFDQGEYTIVAVNQKGESRMSAKLSVTGNRNDTHLHCICYE